MQKFKSTLVFIFLLACTIATASANPTKNRRNANNHIDIPFKLGAKLGGGPAYMLKIAGDMQGGQDLVEMSSSLLRPQVWLFGEYLLTRTWGIQLNLAYLGQGGSVKEEHGGQKIANNLYSQYFLVAPTFRCYPGDGRQLCIFFGPHLSYLTSYKCERYVDGKKQGDTVNMFKILKDSIRRFDFGLALGFDYEFDVNIVLGSGANFGFLSMYKVPDAQLAEAKRQGRQAPKVDKLLNIVSYVYVGYNFAPLFM